MSCIETSRHRICVLPFSSSMFTVCLILSPHVAHSSGCQRPCRQFPCETGRLWVCQKGGPGENIGNYRIFKMCSDVINILLCVMSLRSDQQWRGEDQLRRGKCSPNQTFLLTSPNSAGWHVACERVQTTGVALQEFFNCWQGNSTMRWGL